MERSDLQSTFADKQKNLSFNIYVQGVRCKQSKTVKMFVLDHVKCP